MKFLFKKNIKFVECIRTYSNLLILFIFGTITNFSAWYTMWPYSTIMWQKEKNINRIINISFATQISYTLFLLFGDSYYIGEFFYINTVLLIIIFNLILNYTSKKELKSYGTNIIN